MMKTVAFFLAFSVLAPVVAHADDAKAQAYIQQLRGQRDFFADQLAEAGAQLEAAKAEIAELKKKASAYDNSKGMADKP